MAMRVPLFYSNEKEDTIKIKDFKSPDLSQLAQLWDWQIMPRNAISLEVISEDVPQQCGWTPRTRVSTSTIGEAWKTTSWSDTEKKWKILHSATRSLNSFKINWNRQWLCWTMHYGNARIHAFLSSPSWCTVHCHVLDRTHARENECRVMIDALAKECFLMGVNQAIRNMHMQKRPVTLT